MRRYIATIMAIGLVSCGDGVSIVENEKSYETYEDFLQALATIYRGKPEDYSRPYALMKNGIAGPDWLLTVHGLPNNLAVCEEIIVPYNEDPSLSVSPGTYYCKEINEKFWRE